MIDKIVFLIFFISTCTMILEKEGAKARCDLRGTIVWRKGRWSLFLLNSFLSAGLSHLLWGKSLETVLSKQIQAPAGFKAGLWQRAVGKYWEVQVRSWVDICCKSLGGSGGKSASGAGLWRRRFGPVLSLRRKCWASPKKKLTINRNPPIRIYKYIHIHIYIHIHLFLMIDDPSRFPGCHSWFACLWRPSWHSHGMGGGARSAPPAAGPREDNSGRDAHDNLL